MSLEAALRAALPTDVAVACVPIDVTHPPLFPAEEAAMAKARPMRRQEFAAGRACARQALAAVGGPAVAIPVAEDRRPLWPNGYVGAITHKGAWAAAIAGPAERYARLGLDLETDEPLPAGVAGGICLPEELAKGASLTLQYGRLLDRGKLTFVAKETLFKAYYPTALHFLDFPDARVAFGPDAGTFATELMRADAPSLAGRRQFQGRFGWAEDMLFAVMVVGGL